MINYSKLYRHALSAYNLVPYHFLNGYSLSPKQIFFIVTLKCNLRCDMCIWIKEKWPVGEMSFQQVMDVIGKLPSGSLLSFTGGEPFTRADMMDILSESAKGHRLHIITNGTLLDEEKTERLVRLGARTVFSKGLLMVGLSVHGDKASHETLTAREGSHATTLEAVRRIIRHRRAAGKKYPLVHTTTVITSENYTNLSGVYEMCADTGVDITNFVIQSVTEYAHRFDLPDGEGLGVRPRVESGMDPVVLMEELNRLIDKAKKRKTELRFSPDIPPAEIVEYYQDRMDLTRYNCNALWTKAVISPYGDLLTCFYKLGDLKKEDLSRLWNTEKVRSLRKRLRDKGLYPGCAGCCHLNFRGNH